MASGWNFLFWCLDRYADKAAFDIRAVSAVRIQIATRSGTPASVTLDDLRIQDGLQREDNPTGGFWNPPFGRPQYGVYDLEPDGLRLHNVRQAQYPSNGDHGRMLTTAPVSQDFVLRIDFTLEGLSPDRTGSWFRVTYDFEPENDAGHEWFGVFLSLEYDRFGLAAVWPVVFRTLIAEEPLAGELRSKKQFVARDGQLYRIELKVCGQKAVARLSEIRGGQVLPKVTVAHVFERLRHGGDARYPLAIEATGNASVLIHDIELVDST